MSFISAALTRRWREVTDEDYHSIERVVHLARQRGWSYDAFDSPRYGYCVRFGTEGDLAGESCDAVHTSLASAHILAYVRRHDMEAGS